MDEVTTSGQYIARDWIEMQPGFSFTAASPTATVAKEVVLTWYYSNEYPWAPHMTINSQTYAGTSFTSSYTFNQFFGAIGTLIDNINDDFTSEEGWTFTPTSNSAKQYVQITVKHASDFVISGYDDNYDVISLHQAYLPATDGTFTAQIDKSLICSTEYLETQPDMDRTTDYSLPVGATKGSFNVTPTGAATYTVPIIIPPGTAGFQPNLSLFYNSQGGNGLLGMGWGISGLSVINRVPTTLYNDGLIDAVDFDDNDRFALDGNRLIKKAGTYGQTGSSYVTELESHVVIKMLDENSDGTPEFKVWTKDGKVLEFGATPDSRIKVGNKVLSWHINKISDVNGNYVSFHYINQNGEFYISEIRYTGNDQLQPVIEPYNSIKFYYEKRGDVTQTVLQNTIIKQEKLLYNVSIYNGAELTKEYRLGYFNALNDADFVSHLSEITEYDSHGVRLNSTIFNWGGTVWNGNDMYAGASSLVESEESQFYIGDFNGDGLTDLLRSPAEVASGSPSTLELYINDSGYGFHYADEIATPADMWLITNNNISEKYFAQANLGASSKTDFDGDGKDEVVAISAVIDDIISGEDIKSLVLRVYKVEEENIIDDPDLLVFSCESRLLFGDPFGKGRTTAIACELGTNTVRMQTLYPFLYLSYNLPITVNAEDKTYLLDFNGNGKQDLLIVKSNGSYIYEFKDVTPVGYDEFELLYTGSFPTSNTIIYPGDFNGDAKTDLLYYDKTSSPYTWRLRHSTGTVFENLNNVPFTNPTLTVTPDVSGQSLIVNDYNGDGRDDIAEIYGTHIDVSYSYNYGNFLKEANTSTGIVGSEEDDFSTGDFFGDGKVTMFFHNTEGSAGNSQARVISFHKGEIKNFMTAIKDGMNNEISIDYESISSSSSNFYTKETTASYPVTDIQAALYVVKTYSANNGVGTINTNSYTYKGAKLHKQGKGFLGFSEIIAKNNRTNLLVTSQYESRFIVNGIAYFFPMLKMSKSSIIEPGNELGVNEIAYTNTISVLDAENRRILPKTTVVKEQDLFNKTSITTTNTVNDDGNIIQSFVKYEQEEEDDLIYTVKTVKTDYNNYIDAITITGDFNTVPNKPTELVVTKTHKDDENNLNESIREVTYEYYANGAIKKEISDPGKVKAVTTDYQYYTAGPLQGISQNTPGEQERHKSYGYDSYYRYLTSETDASGNSISKTYDPKTGLVLTTTDIQGNTTGYSYDGFGNLIMTLMPDFQTINSAINWCKQDIPDLSNEVYYKEITCEGKAPVFTYYDRFGREVRVVTKSLSGQNINVDKVYNNIGQVTKTSRPYFEGGSAKWTIYEYDGYGRPTLENYNEGTLVLEHEYMPRRVKAINRSVTPNQWSEKTTDAAGNITKAEDLGGVVNYTYSANGLVHQVSAPGSTITTTYDDYYRQQTLQDPDAGTNTYEYNGFGELIYQKDANQIEYSMTYDELGRIATKTGAEGITSYEYITEGNGIGELAMVTGPNNITDAYYYDQYGRILSKTSTIESGQVLTSGYEYDDYGRLARIMYPADFSVEQVYNQFGYLIEVRRGDTDALIWKAGSQNEAGQWSNYTLGNNLLSTAYAYDVYNNITSLTTQKVSGGTYLQNLEYEFNGATGNLNWRKDKLHLNGTVPYIEEFGYDNLNRLTWAKVNGSNQLNVAYNNDISGIISAKDSIGTYLYESIHPHLVTKIADAPGSLIMKDHEITYTPFNKVYTINQNSSEDLVTLTYGPDLQRRKMVHEKNGINVLTRYYDQGYEKEITNGVMRHICYIHGGDGLAAIMAIDGSGNKTMYYILKDHLGSFNVIANESGTIATFNGVPQEYSFDPWGRRRNPNDWSYDNVPTAFLFDRGFTGHEHMDVFGLINMNGRVYDPVLGVFLSPDNYVQAPDFSQNFNRYGYCFNNPLVYTDPDGEIAWFIPVIIGAVIGASSGAVMADLEGAHGFWEWASYVGGGAIAGAGLGLGFSSGLSALGGNVTGMAGYGSNLALDITTNSLLTANIGMVSSALQGRNLDGVFKSGLVGLAAGGLGAWSTSLIGGSSISANFFQEEINTFGQIVTGATYGFGDRFFRGHEMGYRGGRLWGTAFLGMLEGGLSGYYGGKLGEEVSFSGQSIIANSIASIPGLGFSITKYLGYGLAAYGGVAAGILSGEGVASLFAGKTLRALTGGITGATVGIGSFSLYPLTLNYIKKHSEFYPTVLTIDQIIKSFFKSFSE
ncbi:MAG: VCBS repeat-containing protein [Bacteroidales bacterium]|nr:VCBS repeat-containing protein [Bacteroidales bacterium]